MLKALRRYLSSSPLPPSEEEIRHALAFLPLPIESLHQQGSKIYLALLVPKNTEAQLQEPVRQAAQQALERLRGVEAALVTLTAERTRPPPPTPQRMPNIRFVIAIASGKGGVGKSTLTAHLALSLRALGWQVGVLDADIYGPSLPRLFAVTHPPEVVEKRLHPLEAHGLKLMSMGFMVEEKAAVMWRGPMVTSALRQMLREVEWGTLDCLLIDLPPGTGDIHLSLVQNLPLSGAVIVSTPQDLALLDARRAVALFERVNVPIIGLVENMSQFECPSCGQASYIFAHGGVAQEAQAHHLPFLGEIPLTLAIRHSCDTGTLTLTPPFETIAKKVKEMLETSEK